MYSAFIENQYYEEKIYDEVENDEHLSGSIESKTAGVHDVKEPYYEEVKLHVPAGAARHDETNSLKMQNESMSMNMTTNIVYYSAKPKSVKMVPNVAYEAVAFKQH